MTFHIRGFMAFRSNDQCYGYNRCIVCDNVPILCTHVHPGITINVVGGSFPFHRTENVFSIFRVPKMGYFVKQPPNERFKMEPPHFSQILGNLKWTTSQPGYLKHFRPPFVKKINSCRIGRKSVSSELQVHDIMLMIFWKNHYQVNNMLFYHRSSEIFARLGPELRIFMPSILRTGRKRLKNA